MPANGWRGRVCPKQRLRVRRIGDLGHRFCGRNPWWANSGDPLLRDSRFLVTADLFNGGLFRDVWLVFYFPEIQSCVGERIGQHADGGRDFERKPAARVEG